MADPVVGDTEMVAKWLQKSPAHVRLLVHRGLIEPIGREPRRHGSGGRPRLLFDLRAVQDALRDTQFWPGS